jgi:hypothetical protein
MGMSSDSDRKEKVNEFQLDERQHETPQRQCILSNERLAAPDDIKTLGIALG